MESVCEQILPQNLLDLGLDFDFTILMHEYAFIWNMLA